MSPQFSANDIEMLIRKSDLDALAKKADKQMPPCPSCGRYHFLDFGGQRYCHSAHHFAHLPAGSLSPREREIALMFGAKEEDL